MTFELCKATCRISGRVLDQQAIMGPNGPVAYVAIPCCSCGEEHEPPQTGKAKSMHDLKRNAWIANVKRILGYTTEEAEAACDKINPTFDNTIRPFDMRFASSDYRFNPGVPEITV